jgi:hypothetical protein
VTQPNGIESAKHDRVRGTDEIRRDASRLERVASTFVFVRKRLGWGYALLWLCTRFARRFSLHLFVVTTHPFGDQHGRPPVNGVRLESRLLTHDEVLHFFDRDEDGSYSRAFATDALSRGHRCAGIVDADRLLWHCWFARGPAPVFENVEAEVDRPFLYGYNVCTDLAHRGRGLHEAGLRTAAGIFAREGYRAFTAYIEVDNLPPLIAAAKMGERFVGFAFVHVRAGAVRWLATPGCRKGGFRLRRPEPATLSRPGTAPSRDVAQNTTT